MNKIRYIIFILFFSSANLSFAQNNENPPPSYPEISKIFKTYQKLGDYNLKVFGLKIYYIELFSDKNAYSLNNNLAIVINYQRDFSKKILVDRSIQEIKKNNLIKDQTILSSYQKKLNEVYSDVKSGDRKTAYFNPQNGVELYFNGQKIGEINDLVFAKRFMGIWLNPNSSYPKMTKSLIGKNE